MKNFYRKVAVTSVCTALIFALEPNKEVKAGPPEHLFYSTSTKSFLIGDTNEDGLGDYIYGTVYSPVGQLGQTEYRSFYVFNIAEFLTSPKSIETAYLQFNASAFGAHPNSYGPSFQLEAYSYDYPGEDIAIPLSVFETGEYLDSSEKFSELSPYNLSFSFNVLPFIKEKVKNNSPFVGFGIRDTYNSKTSSDDENGLIFLQEKAHLYIIAPPEPVPEPTTIFGLAIGLYLGGLLKRKKSISK